LAPDELPVPAQHGFRIDQKRPPRWARQLLREGGEDEAISGLPARRSGGALEHVQLMAQHQQLDVAIAVSAGEQASRSRPKMA
jgi:hypothetical protein